MANLTLKSSCKGILTQSVVFAAPGTVALRSVRFPFGAPFCNFAPLG